MLPHTKKKGRKMRIKFWKIKFLLHLDSTQNEGKNEERDKGKASKTMFVLRTLNS